MTDKTPKLLVDALGAIIHGYDSVNDKLVYLTVTEDLDALKVELTRLLDARGWAI